MTNCPECEKCGEMFTTNQKQSPPMCAVCTARDVARRRNHGRP